MSDEQARKRDESESTNDDDVVAHGFVSDEPGEDDPERKRKRKQSEDADTDELGRKRK
jgi:hypothetical protein